MDEPQIRAEHCFTTTTEINATRDENRSPTSGSSSEAYAEESKLPRAQRNRKPSSASRTKRKRKWRPYNELSWDEKKMQDDRETRRAHEKRERLSAEGHPIAPYNTTQFLMDDRRTPSSGNLALLWRCWSPANAISNKCVGEDIIKDSQTGHYVEHNNVSVNQMGSVDSDIADDARKEICNNDESDRQTHNFLHSATDGSLAPVETSNGEKSGNSLVGNQQESIQSYIMDDFSHTYADIHAEQLQTMSKADLVEECLKLEKRVEGLEKRLKDCKRKHRNENKGRTDAHLLEKINQLQAVNAQLLKEHEGTENTSQSSSSDPGAHL
ncbi:protein HEXIM2-like [Watersipora subatra]|uniref:protein HEXIM2-like n=1 Tax=Watersipora subatra TaxID=2589382 RepID=UPI00355B8CF3